LRNQGNVYLATQGSDNESGGESYYNLVPDIDHALSTDNKLFFNAFLDTLTAEQQDLIGLVKAGIKQTEIARHFEVTQQAISSRLITIENKWIDYTKATKTNIY
jgi:DNA-binding NarL/FixJ family response regulator